MSAPEDFRRLKEKLDEFFSWPALYPFKFIVPHAKLDEVKGLFPGVELTLRESRKGRYVSVTAEVLMESSDAVVAVYERAQGIEGIISL